MFPCRIDAPNRLASAQTTAGPTPWGQSYTFLERAQRPAVRDCALDDGFGNLTDQNVIAGSAPSMHVAYNPANNRQTGDSADANGNITPTGGGYVYDVLNRLTSASGASYGYDAQNHRITRTDSSGNQYYTFWGADGEKLCETNIYGTVQQSWAYFGAKLFYNSNTGYVVADRLGSMNGKYYPYGQERPSATSVDTEKFTGYFRDSATGLDYAVNRYHQPGMGRFMTADPLASSASGNDPGSLNRYAYVGGDPANRVDPSVTDDCSPGDTLPCSTTVNDPGDPAGGGGGGGSSSGGGTSTSAPCHGYGAAYAACMQQWAAQQALMNQWNSLSGTCQQGLLWAVPSTSISGVLAALGRATAAQSTLQAATAGTSISWEMLAAIGIRESGFQNKPQANGGPGQGIFQITVPGSGLTAAQAGNLTTAATWAANFLNNDMAYLAAKFPGFTPAQLLQATAASYNLGPHGITGNPATIDKGSAPAPKAEGNYGSNILQLMTCFQ